jgi:hypothetical protein
MTFNHTRMKAESGVKPKSLPAFKVMPEIFSGFNFGQKGWDAIFHRIAGKPYSL